VNDVDSRMAAANMRSVLIGLALLVVAGGVLFFTSGFVFQAFRGPRPITDQELLGITAPGSGDNYVSFTPSRPFVDTGLQWGKKNNPGTKFLLLPVGDRLMLCSARIADNGPTFTGRLEQIGGGTEEEALNRIKASNPGVGPRLMPIMFQTVRSIWFDTAVALVAILGLGLGGLWMLLRPLLRKGERGFSEA
jgi:hypothetical protein